MSKRALDADEFSECRKQQSAPPMLTRQTQWAVQSSLRHRSGRPHHAQDKFIERRGADGLCAAQIVLSAVTGNGILVLLEELPVGSKIFFRDRHAVRGLVLDV